MLKLPQLSDFTPLLGESFSIVLGDSNVITTLAEAKPLGPASQSRGFELVFCSASQIVLPARTYTFRNPNLGEMGIFISPFARDSAGIVYQAVFN